MACGLLNDPFKSKTGPLFVRRMCQFTQGRYVNSRQLLQPIFRGGGDSYHYLYAKSRSWHIRKKLAWQKTTRTLNRRLKALIECSNRETFWLTFLTGICISRVDSHFMCCLSFQIQKLTAFALYLNWKGSIKCSF